MVQSAEGVEARRTLITEIVEETFLDEFMDEWTLTGYTPVNTCMIA